MIEAKQVFFSASNFKGHGFHRNKATILYLTLKYYLLSVVSEKIYFLEIGSVNQKLWPFKCMMLKTLRSNFLDWEDTLKWKYFSRKKDRKGGFPLFAETTRSELASTP